MANMKGSPELRSIRMRRKAVKKRRDKKDSIWIVYEGYRERYLLDYLAQNSNIKLNTKFTSGGTANYIVITAIQYSARGEAVYAFFDEDFEHKPGSRITDETLEGLAQQWKQDVTNLLNQPYNQLQKQNTDNLNPILIVSNPCSLEGLILRMLGRSVESLRNQKTDLLKNELDRFINGCTLIEEDIEKIHIIDERIKRFKSELQQTSSPEINRYFLSKIEEENRNKSRVKFMRFIHQNLPIDKIANIRKCMPEIDILLKAFQIL
jgi:hypothetical protein